MTRKTTSRGPSARNQRQSPQRHVLAAACYLALIATAQVNAQEAQATDETAAQATPADATVETVKVTGIRSAIISAVETKAESTSIVEAISAEDLGKLPDISIADSISRLPGLTMQRKEGRGEVDEAHISLHLAPGLADAARPADRQRDQHQIVHHAHKRQHSGDQIARRHQGQRDQRGAPLQPAGRARPARGGRGWRGPHPARDSAATNSGSAPAHPRPGIRPPRRTACAQA